MASTFDFAAGSFSLFRPQWPVTCFNCLDLRQRLSIARAKLELAEQTCAIVDARYRNGRCDRSELARQRTTVLVVA